jgi:hypothetical protein
MVVGSDAGKAGEVNEEAQRKKKKGLFLSVPEEKKPGKKIVAPNAFTEATAAGGSSMDMRNKGRAGIDSGFIDERSQSIAVKRFQQIFSSKTRR